eukprot:jgi/Bigna1/71578/fgenesh1_pg.16_\
MAALFLRVWEIKTSMFERYGPSKSALRVTLAAIVLSAVTNLIEPKEVFLLWKDFWACAIVFLCTLFLGVEAALALGIVCNWAISLSKANSTTVAIIGRRTCADKMTSSRIRLTQHNKDHAESNATAYSTTTPSSQQNHHHGEANATTPGSVSSLVDLGNGSFTGESYDRTVLMRLYSDLSFSRCGSLHVVLVPSGMQPNTIIVDCTNVNNIDVTGVRTLMVLSLNLKSTTEASRVMQHETSGFPCPCCHAHFPTCESPNNSQMTTKASGSLLCLASMPAASLKVLRRAHKHLPELREGKARWIFRANCDVEEENEEDHIDDITDDALKKSEDDYKELKNLYKVIYAPHRVHTTCYAVTYIFRPKARCIMSWTTHRSGSVYSSPWHPLSPLQGLFINKITDDGEDNY